MHMKNINAKTRKFISNNIKLNTTTSSYPLRTVTSDIPELSSKNKVHIEDTVNVTENNSK